MHVYTYTYMHRTYWMTASPFTAKWDGSSKLFILLRTWYTNKYRMMNRCKYRLYKSERMSPSRRNRGKIKCFQASDLRATLTFWHHMEDKFCPMIATLCVYAVSIDLSWLWMVKGIPLSPSLSSSYSSSSLIFSFGQVLWHCFRWTRDGHFRPPFRGWWRTMRCLSTTDFEQISTDDASRSVLLW